jgi:hypothetical protein
LASANQDLSPHTSGCTACVNSASFAALFL